MKVLNILEEGRFGGPQRRVVDVASALKSMNVETVVVFPKQNSDYLLSQLNEMSIAHKAISLRRLTVSPSGFVAYMAFFIPEVYRLTKLIKQYKPCMVHTNGSYQIKGILASKLAGAKNIWHLNDTQTPKLVWYIFRFVAKYFADSFISASQRTTSYYLGRGHWNKRLTKLNEPVDSQYFTPRPRPLLGSKPEILIMTIGNTSPVKGLEIFIELAAKLNVLTHYDLKFEIVGKELANQSVYLTRLYGLIEQYQLDNVFFKGESRDVRDQLQRADIYVCTSHFESSPMAVWEAMSMQLPIVATDVGDIKSIFTENECGLVSEVGNTSQLVQLLLTYLNNPDMAEGYAKRAREIAIRDFDISNCVKGHYDHYQQLSSP
jgi:glycosyltransferase involved in cell wall biosynthesis